MKLAVVCPHFEPDVAPTGAVMTRIVHELAARGHRLEVFTSLPWYREHRIEPAYGGRMVRYEDTPWGRIARIHPFPTSDKRNLVRRAAAYAGYSTLATAIGMRGGPVDGVLAMSPPLTLGLTGWAIAKRRGAPLIFNVQDVYPDVAVELGMLTNARVIALARRLERICYERADAVTVLSEDVMENVTTKTRSRTRVREIPNFVDTNTITPRPKDNAYRREFGLSDKRVVMYAGNVGLSQSLDLIIEAAAALAYEEDLVFVINGGGAARAALERRAEGMPNVRFVDIQPPDRLPEVLAAADLHLVPLRRGLARSSVPSKTYSVMAAGRPQLASVDRGSEITRLLERSGGGVSVAPEDAEAFTKALRDLLDAPERMEEMGRAARSFVEGWASPAAVARSYEELFEELRGELGGR
ncbi:MAG TPA: glycosyltransferase family 4 protein [Actinomycetota bacterium]|nr:glycosyltransferase family 4 protein [Actinomycetota bacterium]